MFWLYVTFLPVPDRMASENKTRKMYWCYFISFTILRGYFYIFWHF